MNLKIVIRVLGFLLLAEGVAMLFALAVSLVYHEHDIQAFLTSAGINAAIGALFVFLTQKAGKDIGKREGFIIISLVWIFFSFFGSLPYILSGSIPNFTTQAGILS